MAIQPAVCTQCGGSLKVDDIDLNGFCQCSYCGTSHRVIDVITVDGLPTVRSLLTNAEIMKEEGNLDNAVKIYKEIIKIKPNCHEAWWGLYICNAIFDRYYQYKDKYGNSGPIVKANILDNTIKKYASYAIKFAPPEQSKIYLQNIKEAQDYIDEIKKNILDQKEKKSKSNNPILLFIKNILKGG